MERLRIKNISLISRFVLFVSCSITNLALWGQVTVPSKLLDDAKAGNPTAQNKLGLLYMQNGEKTLAVNWWKKAADLNCAGACVNLGSYYLENNDPDAKYWYLKGVELQDSLAYRGLGIYYDRVEHDTKSSIFWLKRGADAGDVNSQRILGFWYLRQNEFENAISFFLKAVEKGDNLSMRGIADSYYNIKDYKNALFWYNERAVQGDSECQRLLSYMFTYGQGTDIDHDAARYWLKRAADGGSAQAQFNLGIFYNRGAIGLPQNEEKALDWFKKAAEQGHPEALNNVGVYYYNHGKSNDALYYWNLAVQKGSKDAEENITRLRK